MKYMGSKARHAKEILPIILNSRKNGQWYVEPFVGGANMIDKVKGPRMGNDAFSPLVSLHKALSSGWLPPEEISEEEYKRIKNNKVNYPPELVAYCGFQLSYGAVWFSTYRRDKIGKRNYSKEAYNNVKKQAPMLSGVDFFCGSYEELKIPKESIIYCDPPYAGTTGYETGSFNHKKFWRWCDDKIDDGHTVFVSEYTAPKHWECVWEKKVNNTLTKDTGSKQGVERLFTRR